MVGNIPHVIALCHGFNHFWPSNILNLNFLWFWESIPHCQKGIPHSQKVYCMIMQYALTSYMTHTNYHSMWYASNHGIVSLMRQCWTPNWWTMGPTHNTITWFSLIIRCSYDPNSCGQPSHTTQTFGLLLSLDAAMIPTPVVSPHIPPRLLVFSYH